MSYKNNLTLYGDTTGSTDAVVVEKLRGKTIDSSIATAGASQDGYILTWVNGSSAFLLTSTAAAFSAGGDLSGSATNQNVINIHGASVPVAGALVTGNGLYVTGASALSYSALNLAGGANYVTGSLPSANQSDQTLVGDVSGTTGANTVNKVHAVTYPVGGALITGQIPVVSGVSAVTYGPLDLSNLFAITGVLPDGYQAAQTVGGDISGTTAAATVNKLKGKSLAAGVGTAGAAQDGYLLTWVNGSSEYQLLSTAASFTAGGDLSGTATSQVVEKVHGATAPIAGALTTGNVLQVNGASSLTYGAINLAGGANYVTGSLPNTNQSDQNMAGDVSGTTGASTVDKLKGKSLAAGIGTAGAAQDGYILTWVNGSTDYEILPPALATTGVFGAIELAGDLNGSGTSAATPRVGMLTGNGSGLVPVPTAVFSMGTNPASAGLFRTANNPSGGIIAARNNANSQNVPLLTLNTADKIVIGDGYGVGYNLGIVLDSNVLVTGNIIINGTTATINSTVVDVADRIIHVNNTTGITPAPTQITGYSIHRGSVDGVTDRDHAGLFWNEATSSFMAAYNTAGDDSTLAAKLPIVSARKVTTITASHTVLSTEDLVIITTNGGGITVTLPATPDLGDTYAVKDGVGNSSTNTITISGNGNNIDGVSTFVLNSNWSSICLVWNSIQWNVV